MSMTYVQLQNAVLDSAFAESKRSDAKNWIQFRHAWLWDLREWAFKFASASVTVTASSQTVSGLPTDFGTALALYDAQGSQVQPVTDPRQFFAQYNANLGNGSTTPEAFTVVGASMLVGPAASATSTSWLLVYEKTKPTLSADGDTTGLPEGYDLALVHGAKAEGFKLSNVPLADAFDADFQAAITAMESTYLTKMRVTEVWGGAHTWG